MKKFILFPIIGIFMLSCESQQSPVMTDHYFDLKNRTIASDEISHTQKGKTYLSAYSQIYYDTKYHKYSLTITVSIKNADYNNRAYLMKADYYDTNGKLLKEYLKEPIFIDPLETVEIVVDEDDKSGGTGGNFLFHWATEGEIDPIFEAVMISTKSQQGISFVTTGVRIE